MIQVIHQSIPTAKKDYDCEASLFIQEGIQWGEFTFSEWRSIVKAKQAGWKIKKGEKYVRQFNTNGSETWTFRARPEIHEICLKYDYYQE